MRRFPYFTVGFFCVYAVASLQPYLALALRYKGLSPSQTGIALSVFEAAGIAGPFVFGYFADRWGRYKPGLIAAHIVLFLCLIPLLLFRNPLLIALSMAALGAGFRSLFPLFDAVTTISIGDSGDYGRLRCAGSASFIVMMLLFQFSPLPKPDTPASAVSWFGVTGLCSLTAILIIPAGFTNIAGRNAPERPPETERRRNGNRFWTPLLILGLLMIAFSRLAMTSVNSFFSLFLREAVHWDALGIMLSLSAGSEIPLMFLSKPLIRRFGPLPLLAVSSAATSIRLGIYGLFPVKGCIIIAQLFHSLCYGLFYPAGIAFITACVPPERRALGMSLYLSLGNGLPTFVGTILGGFIIERLGYSAMFGVFALFPLGALGIFALILNVRKGYALPCPLDTKDNLT
ncbi:MAG: MFS transporter [Spirochaetaceae bacterium]|jgi:PPP family 3-phenylpropionic acid transporter|nr:MFS transporter [Spirochaetaceae bacterium]